MLTVEQYNRSTFEHDAEYVDGNIVERSMPTTPHSLMQTFLSFILFTHGAVMTEQRIRIRDRLYRIPDVCFTLKVPREQVLTHPPYLCIEIISPDDSAKTLRDKVSDYLSFGVDYVWVIDPETYSGEVYTQSTTTRITDGIFRAGHIEVDVRMVPKPDDQD